MDYHKQKIYMIHVSAPKIKGVDGWLCLISNARGFRGRVGQNTTFFTLFVKFAFLRSAIPDPRSAIPKLRSAIHDPRSAIRAIPTETKVPNVLIEWGWRKTKQKRSLFVSFWNIWKSRTSATNILIKINSNSKNNDLWIKPSILTNKNSVAE